jgi:hypothetical protein
MPDLPPSSTAGQALIPPDENRRMFDTIARRYDLLNSLISLGQDRAWRRAAVNQLRVQTGGRYADATQYRSILPALMAGWRKDFDLPDLAFHIVQLQPYGARTGSTGWAGVRDAQTLAAMWNKHGGLIVTTDCGDEKEVRPSQKRLVGERLALAARGITVKIRLSDFSLLTRSRTLPDAVADTNKSDFMPKTTRRVVVIGGGWGGATAAKYMRLADPGIELFIRATDGFLGLLARRDVARHAEQQVPVADGDEGRPDFEQERLAALVPVQRFYLHHPFRSHPLHKGFRPGLRTGGGFAQSKRLAFQLAPAVAVLAAGRFVAVHVG